MQIQNRLAEMRQRRGISAAALAKEVDVRRQTIYAIEAGTYIPNTLVSLRLAQALDVKVEDLFCLNEKPSAPQSVREVELLSTNESLQPGQSVRLCRIGKKWVGVPSQPLPGTLPWADGVCVKASSTQRAAVHAFEDEDESAKRLLIAGCDPAVSILGGFVAKEAGIDLIAASCSSLQAISWLKAGKVHIAGSHLRDQKTGEPNVPIVKKLLPDGGYKIITFATWEQGLVVAKGNPKDIREVADLARRGVRLMNREKGSGCRFLLDELLEKGGVEPARVHGYDDVALGHLPAAWHIYSGQADCCMATRVAARTFGLDFVPLTTERYDFIFRERLLDARPIQALLNVLNRSAFHRELEELGNYDMTQTGRMLV
jgi:molybdate-binding protein/DNA-binding XRE family transcriptional regulator